MCRRCEESSSGRFVCEFTYPDGKPSSNFHGGIKPDTDIALLYQKLDETAGSLQTSGPWHNVEQLASFLKKAQIKGRLYAIEILGPYHTGKKWSLEYTGVGRNRAVRMILK